VNRSVRQRLDRLERRLGPASPSDHEYEAALERLRCRYRLLLDAAIQVRRMLRASGDLAPDDRDPAPEELGAPASAPRAIRPPL
jgi:hypothetical protein